MLTVLLSHKLRESLWSCQNRSFITKPRHKSIRKYNESIPISWLTDKKKRKQVSLLCVDSISLTFFLLHFFPPILLISPLLFGPCCFASFSTIFHSFKKWTICVWWRTCCCCRLLQSLLHAHCSVQQLCSAVSLQLKNCIKARCCRIFIVILQCYAELLSVYSASFFVLVCAWSNWNPRKEKNNYFCLFRLIKKKIFQVSWLEFVLWNWEANEEKRKSSDTKSDKKNSNFFFLWMKSQ